MGGGGAGREGLGGVGWWGGWVGVGGGVGWGVQTPHLGETTILWKSNSFAYRLKKPWKREPTLSVLGAVRDMASRSRAASTQKLQSNGRPVGVLASMRSGLASHSPPRSAWYKEMYKEVYTVPCTR